MVRWGKLWEDIERMVLRLSKLIVLDIDEVLADLNSRLIPVNNAYFRREVTPKEYQENWHATRWARGYPVRVFNRMVGSAWNEHAKKVGLYDNVPVVSGARNALLTLAEAGAEFACVTSRATCFLEETLCFLKQSFPEVDFREVIPLGAYDCRDVQKRAHGVTKGEIVRGLEPVAFVDDQPKHALSAAKCGVPSILFGNAMESEGIRPNETPRLYRARSWQEALMILNTLMSD